MSEENQEQPPPDPERINTHEESHMVYWSKKWNISREELGKAVYKTGGRVKDVQKALGNDPG
jgi:hypothetical protein